MEIAWRAHRHPMTTGTRPGTTMPRLKQIEDLALQVQTRARQAADHATADDYRKAHAAAEQAQGTARRLKELLGAHSRPARVA